MIGLKGLTRYRPSLLRAAVVVAAAGAIALSQARPAAATSWTLQDVQASPGDIVSRAIAHKTFVQKVGAQIIKTEQVHFAHRDATGALRHSWWDSAAGWSTEMVDPDGGLEISLALGPNGLPHISYSRAGKVKYARKETNGTWTIETVAAVGYSSYVVGFFSSLAVDANGVPHISYGWFDDTLKHDTLKYATKYNGNWLRLTVDSNISLAGSSIVLDGNNIPHIAYAGWFGDIKYATGFANFWMHETVAFTGSPGGARVSPSIDLDSAERPHVSFRAPAGGLRHARRSATGTWTVSTVDALAGVGAWSSLMIDANDNVHISYYDETNRNLKYARYQPIVRLGQANWSIETVDAAGDTGLGTSLALDAAGKPLISYWDWTNYKLRFARGA